MSQAICPTGTEFARTSHRVRSTRTRAETLLALVVLLIASRSLNIWFPDVGLVSGGRITTLGRLVWPALAGCSLFFVFRRPAESRRRPDRLTRSVLSC